MSPLDHRSDPESLEEYVRAASGALDMELDLAWVPAIAQNLKLLLASAATAQLDSDLTAEPALRFEP